MSSMAEHRRLCDVAERWLRNATGCKIVLGGVSSYHEVPDAIGWSNSCRGGYGSIVVECKRSMSDFYRDRKKKFQSMGLNDDLTQRFEEVERMGDRRYFLCPAGVITTEAVAKHFPDHGLLWTYGGRGRVSVMRAAPTRNNACHASEVVLLKFALIHVKDNLLWAGLTVNLRELTKHPVIADRSGLLHGFEKPARDEEAWLG